MISFYVINRFLSNQKEICHGNQAQEKELLAFTDNDRNDVLRFRLLKVQEYWNNVIKLNKTKQTI